VCDDRAYFENVTSRIIAEARALEPSLGAPAPLVIDDRFKGPAYGVMSDEQLRFLVDVARRTGLVLDPVYSGKALFALAHQDPKPKRVLFIHTGGLAGLLGVPEALAGAV
ncbi:MAG TPA: D-cysteine desulfhydrase family protein, partial [Polyangiaceae bacterium]|nr:D-cysteine desulfhydrase family protein [Polyangiaceae bacterium]